MQASGARDRTGRRTRLTIAVTSALALVAGVLGATPVRAASAGPVTVTPYSGFNPTLTRAPYVTDLTQSTGYVNWATTSSTPGSVLVMPAPGGDCPSSIQTWTSAATTVTTSLPGPVNPTSAGSSSSMTGWAFSVVNGGGSMIQEYQASVQLTGLSPGSQYCYAVFSTHAAGAVDLLPPTRPYQTFTTLDPPSTSSTQRLTFVVIGDTGENYSYTTAGDGDVPFPGHVNPDQAAIFKLIGSSGARFLLNAGDIAYAGGNQSTYGDLQQKGSMPEVSTIFGASYYPQTGGIPTFAADGNHGQNVTTLRVWPTPQTATASQGTYAFDSYSAGKGISGTYPDNWYALSSGNVRIYVLDAAWSDRGVGTATGSLCPTPSYCKQYEADADEHWQDSSPEYRWLVSDLAAHQGGVKFAVFHYPLRSANSTQPSDPYLQNSAANPKPSSSLEKLLSDNGIVVAFNGHAHTYQRIVPKQSGQITSYVTGGGGAVLEPVSTGSLCSTLQQSASVYALGWSPSHSTAGAGSGTACGATARQSAAEVFHFLKVTVDGNQVTVTPTNAAGGTFDVQTYSATGGTSGGGTSGGSGTSIGPTDDATISRASATAGTNYGHQATLAVDGDQNLNDFLMKFTVPQGCTPRAASLTVTVAGGSSNGSPRGGDFFAAPGTWSEATINANNAPSVTGSAVSLGAVAVNRAYTLDVTSLLPPGVGSGASMSIRAKTTSSDAAVYVSGDAANGSTAGPRLQLTC